MWPGSPPAAVGWTVEEGGPGDLGPGATARDGWVAASVRDGGQKYSYILSEARGSTSLLH